MSGSVEVGAGNKGTTVHDGGGVVWRIKNDKLQVQLVHRPRYDDWSWPKGHLDDGESHQTAAVREVAEETGSPVVLGLPLPTLRYRMPSGDWKRVAYWAARQATASDRAALNARKPVEPARHEEIDKVKWFDHDVALHRLTRRSDRKPLQTLMAAYEAGRLTTHAVVIARHGKATPRAEWHGDEVHRPLTPIGEAHASALVPVLAAYGVRRVVSSRWARCTGTVAPYVRASGLAPWFSDNLTESSHEKSPERVAAVVGELLANKRSSVLCTHRPVLPTVLKVLRSAATVSAAQLLPTDDPYLNPGEALVAHVHRRAEGPQIVAFELVQPALY